MAQYTAGAAGPRTSIVAASLPAGVDRFSGKHWDPLKAAVAEVIERRRTAREARARADEIRSQSPECWSL